MVDGFYDTHDTPQAEPLSLQQNHQPQKKGKKKENRGEAVVQLTTPPQEVKSREKVFVPFFFEAVPTQPVNEVADSGDEEDILAEKIFEDIACAIIFKQKNIFEKKWKKV